MELRTYGKLRSLIGIDQSKIEALADIAPDSYKSFDTLIGRKWRHIDNPKDNLKSAQTQILRKILVQVPLPTHMYGAKRGGSILDHAAHHLGQECVMTLDLRNCYPRTSSKQVYAVFVERVGCSPELARVLTKVCTVGYRLPQGAPTSGYLAHLALLDLYAKLRAIATAYGLRLSFYVDDVAMSGKTGAVKAAMGEAIAAITTFGHSIRNKKKLVMVGDDRVVTNLKVGDHLWIQADYVADVEGALVAGIKAGSVSSDECARLAGKIAWVRRVSPSQAGVLEELFLQVSKGPARARPRPQIRACSGKADCLWHKENQAQYVRRVRAAS